MDLEKYSYMSLHAHTDRSNFRLKDAINKPADLLETSLEKGLKGVAITDHETLAAHVEAYRYLNKNKEHFGDFKLGFGNEIYLVDRKDTVTKEEKNEKVKYFHFILLAKNQHGYDFLRKQSTKAWENSHFYRGMERVPTYKDELIRLMKSYKGDIMASTSCIGGELPQLLLKYDKDQSLENKMAIHEFITTMQDVFGKDDFYFELQPSAGEEQKIVNKWLVKVAKAYNVKLIITTDAHYLSKEQKQAHKIFLQSQQGDREVDSFYATTYLFTPAELRDYFEDDLLTVMFKNTHEIMDKMEPISFEHETIIPEAHMPEFEPIDLKNVNAQVDWNKYPDINEYADSENKYDLYYIKLIMEGMIEKNQEFNHENLDRINTELHVVKAISNHFKQPMSSYFLAEKEFVDIMWEVSLVGVSRGSASCFYTNYLLDIVQINAIEYNLPYWRFLNVERVSNMPDIDEDAEGAKRQEIIKLVKERFGEDSVLNIGTYNTEGTRSTVLSACRGFGIDTSIANNILDELPGEKGVNWDLKDAFYGNESKNRKPAKKFIDMVSQYPGLKEAMLSIQGVVSGRSQHASGVLVWNGDYTNHVPMMKTTKGLEVTQYDAGNSEYVGGIKYDFLSINAMDRIRAAMDLLLKEGKIQWQGTLKATYNKYFHPDVIKLKDPELFKLIYTGEVVNAFQFETSVGRQAFEKINPSTFDEIAAANTLMRMTTDGEQPIDKYVRFKNNINEWYQEMSENGLTEDEQNVLKSLLSDRYGICDTQEYLMTLSMDKNISGFSLAQANKLRKSVAKKNEKLQEQEKAIYFESGRALGTSENMLNYVWEYCFKPQFAYSFSLPHVAGYSLILMIEANICLTYGSLYWKTACLSINAGIYDGVSGSSDYAAVSKAVTRMSDLIMNPDINKSEIGFTPYKGKILFGLGSIIGIGQEEIIDIVSHRPYSNLEDYLNKTNLTDRKNVIMIKSGAFDGFNKDRRALMVEFVRYITPEKTRLTTVQLPKISNDVPSEYAKELAAYNFKNKITGRKAQKMNSDIEKEFLSEYSSSVNYTYDNGELVIDVKSFTKWFNKFAQPLKEWLKTKEAIAAEAKVRMREFWKENCMGTVAAWEMDSLNCYIGEHELNLINLDKIYDIVSFSNMSKEPEISGYKTWKGRKYPQQVKKTIAGTVVDKDKRGIIYLLTNDHDIVSVRIGKERYGYYNKRVVKDKKVIEDSWLQRGNRMVVVGYRRENDFIANSKGTSYSSPIFLIKKDGQIATQKAS